MMFLFLVAAALAAVVDITNNFDEAIKTDKLVFVKHYAPWCGHCKALAPKWTQFAEEMESDPNVIVAEVDCTVAREVCNAQGVRGYPTLRLYQNGEFKNAYTGAREVDAFKNFIAQNK